MEPKLSWIILIVFVSTKRCFVSGKYHKFVRTGTFKYLHQHPKLKNCAMEVFNNDLYVGGRVRMLTGECEDLNDSWAINQTLQSGYAYTKKVSVQENYITPLDGLVSWKIPGILREGAAVAIIRGIPPDKGSLLSLDDTRDDDVPLGVGKYNMIVWSTKNSYLNTTEHGMSEYNRSSNSYGSAQTCVEQQRRRQMKEKISFRAHTGSLELLVDDHSICLVNVTMDLTTIRQVRMTVLKEGPIYGYEFIYA